MYNAEAGRIEMYLDATRDQVVAIDGERIAFRCGETLHTENSYKYAPDEFVAKAGRAGLDCVDVYQDRQRPFHGAVAARYRSVAAQFFAQRKRDSA